MGTPRRPRGADVAAALKEMGIPVRLAAAMGDLAASALPVAPQNVAAARTEALNSLADDLAAMSEDLRQGTPRAPDVAESLGLAAYEVGTAFRVLLAVAEMARKRAKAPQR